MARTKLTTRKSTDSKTPRMQLATKAARKSEHLQQRSPTGERMEFTECDRPLIIMYNALLLEKGKSLQKRTDSARIHSRDYFEHGKQTGVLDHSNFPHHPK